MKKHSLSWWKKKADATFSRLVRLRGADESGNVKCITCGIIRHWKDSMDAGHYINRNHLSTRFLEMNTHPQCRGCNHKMFGAGRKDQHALYIIREYGQNALEELDKIKNTNVKYSFCDYQEMIDKWTDELVTLENQFV